MFEVFSSWWGGVISAAAGYLAIHQAVQAIASRERKLFFDFFHSSPKVSRVPPDTRLAYFVNDIETDSLVENFFILKNKTGTPCTDESFITNTEISAPKNCKLIKVDRNDHHGESQYSISLDQERNKIEISNLELPIDGCISIIILASMQIDPQVKWIHKEKKVERRDYTSFQYRMMDFFLLAFIIASLFLYSFEDLFPYLYSDLAAIKIFASMNAEVGKIYTVIGTFFIASAMTLLRKKLLFMSPTEKKFQTMKRRMSSSF